MPKACEKRNVPPAFLNRILCKCVQYSGHRLWAVCVQTAVIFCVQLAVIACVHHYLQLPNAVDIMMPKACEKRNVPPAFLNRILCKCVQYSGHRLWAVCVQTAVIFCVQLAVIACVLVACLFAFVACVFILCVRVCVWLKGINSK